MGEQTALINGIVVCMDRKRTVLNRGHVVFQNDLIVQITDKFEEIDFNRIDQILDVSGKVVFPGLINSHMHMRPARALGDGFNTPDWHDMYVDPISERMTPEDAFWGAQLAFAELVKSGTTTCLGMTIHGEPEFEAAVNIGIRTRLVPHAEDYEALRINMEEVSEQSGDEQDLVRHWLGMEVTSLFDTEQLNEMRICANKTGSRIHTHFSEYNRESIDLLLESDFLDEDVILAHCVHVNTEEIQILGDKGVSVVHNPKSNMRLGSGIAPIVEMKEQHVNVSLGTDGPLSTYKIDMWEEIRNAALLHRLNDPQALNAWDVLEMATINGAKALGMDSVTGSLEVGKKADIIVIDVNKPHTAPLIKDGPHSNIVPLLVFAISGSDIDTTIINGEMIVKDKQILTINEEDAINEVNERGKRIVNDLDF